jgi:hypothetical protein
MREETQRKKRDTEFALARENFGGRVFFLFSQSKSVQRGGDKKK